MEQAQSSLIDAIEEFVAANSMSPITFGREAMNDPHFVRDLRNGRRVWPETDAKARTFMATYRPDTQVEQAA